MSLASELSERYAKLYTSKVFRQDHPRASAIGECAREVYHQIVDWALRPPPSPELLQRFERGSELHKVVARKLLEMGLEFTESERPIEIIEDGLIICTGHVDGILTIGSERFVVEIKSLNPNVWARINSADDFWRMGSFWTKYIRQILLYTHHYNMDGMFILDDCLGHLKFIPIKMQDWQVPCLDALETCKVAAKAAAKGEPPDDYASPSACAQCWCRAANVCFPPLSCEQTGGVIEDVEVVTSLERMEELKEAAKEYNGLDKVFKADIKVRGAGNYVAGPFVIRAKGGETTKYDVPEEVRRQYAKKVPMIRTTWERWNHPEKE